jgi:UDP-N-acetylmuramate--alanine ligase
MATMMNSHEPFRGLSGLLHPQIHLVGIGGTGLSSIARVLLERGLSVSGSDRALTPQTALLQADGARIFLGHDAGNITGADALLVTSAAKPDNPEIVAAHAADIPVYKRRDFLPWLLADNRVTGVSGTHGKTTTTAMTVHILREAGRHPGYVVGSVMQNTGTNASSGASGAPFVIEADEYDDMYLGLTPQTAILTSVEWDHPDFFPSEQDVLRSFQTYLARVKPGGVVIACTDYPHARALTETLTDQSVTVIRYGHDAAYADAVIRDLRVDENGLLRFSLIWKQESTSFALRIPGNYNAFNATAAALAALQEGVPLPASADALATFSGTARRFTVVALGDGLTGVNDYAHHPTAIRITLESARLRYPGQQIWAVWQPHTFSRTRALLSDYVASFAAADHVLVTDIYAAREPLEPDFNGAVVARAIAENHADARYSGTLQATADMLRQRVQRPAVAVILSAGDAPKILDLLVTA